MLRFALKYFKRWLQIHDREAAARQVEVAALRKTGEAHRRKVKQLEQELAGQRSIAKVCFSP